MIEFARTHVIGRAAGHSAVKASAYRSGTKQHDERIGVTADYSHRADGVAHSEIMLPAGALESLSDRAALWHAVEAAEDGSTRRSTAQLAKDHIIALPVELSLLQQIEMAREFAQKEFVNLGVGVDLNVHLHSDGNPHAHLMVTTRVITGEGLGAKARHLNGKFYGGQRLPEAEQLRHKWADFQNIWCAERDIDLFVTNNNGEWAAEKHRGPTEHLNPEVREIPIPTADELSAMRSEAIRSDFNGLIDRVAKYKAVFTHKDLLGELLKHVSNPIDFANTQAQLGVFLKEAQSNESHGNVLPLGTTESGEMHYTTHAVIDEEFKLLVVASEMFEPSAKHDRVTDVKRDKVIKQDYDFLSDEQKSAVEHVTSPDRLSVIVGLAGAGKSTMLKAAGDAWRSAGYKVRGAALAGIAAEGLEESAAIKSSTIHSLLHKLDSGKDRLDRNDVLVVDEAGMLDTQLMLRMTRAVNKAGAKMVLVGDPDQLQSIQAGGPLRAMVSQGGFCEISTVRRQRNEDDRKATLDLARGNINDAFNSYKNRGFVTDASSMGDAVNAIVADSIRDIREGANTAVLAHTNKQVKQINSLIRRELVDGGAVKNDSVISVIEEAVLEIAKGDQIQFNMMDDRLDLARGDYGTVTKAGDNSLLVRTGRGGIVRIDASFYKDISISETNKDKNIARYPFKISKLIEIDVGKDDRILFRQNDHALGVKNGSLGTIVSIQRSTLEVKLDTGKTIEVDADQYKDIAYGYAMTVHKSQGVTVDRSRALISKGWDRHLSYVAMSRHRGSLQLYRSTDPKDEAPSMSKSRHQENAISFAQRHGVDILSIAEQRTRLPKVPDQSSISDVVEKGDLTKDELAEMRKEAIRSDFKGLVDRVTKYKAVFSEHDLYRELFKHKSGDDFAKSKKALVMYLKESTSEKSKSTVLPVGQSDKGLVYYTGLKTVTDELRLQRLSSELFARDREHGRVTDESRDKIIQREYDFLSNEQRDAVKHVTSADRLSVIIGLAGAGKSTMLKAAGDAWRAAGYRVRGAALAGIAAEGLEESAAIKSSTIHSLLHKLDSGKDRLERNDVLVVDEAGMLDTQLMLRITRAVAKAGAKMVLVGDPDQLQSIQAGGPLQAMLTQGGYKEISTVRRQHNEEDRRATLDLARGRIGDAYNSYKDRGFVSNAKTIDDAVNNIVLDTVSDLGEGVSTAVLAHSNKHVKQINSQVRGELMHRGILKESARFIITTDQDLEVGKGDDIKFTKDDRRLGVMKGSTGKVVEASDNLLKVKVGPGKVIEVDAGFYKDIKVKMNPGTDNSDRHKFKASHTVNIGVGIGDRIMFRKNDETLGVKNGSLGQVLSTGRKGMRVELDGGRVIKVDVKEYSHFDHGYAMTVHKSQGVTVDRARVLMTAGWDRHISYVAMSRHKNSLHLYKSESFADPVKSMEKSRHQENALSFAEKHGIDAAAIVKERLARARPNRSRDNKVAQTNNPTPRGRGL